jgi:hypothetical protein
MSDKKTFDKIQKIDFSTKLSDFKILNPDFTRCRCSVFYTGKNRNHSNISDNALQKLIARKGYANVPVVGSIKEIDGQKIMGGHDRKLEITDTDIKIINECIPYGVIPEDCNPKMEVITDVHGIEKEYFCVDIILWTHYFPEVMEAAGDSEIFFSQSMEIEVTEGSYDENYDYYNIEDFNLQALCLLGRYSGELKDKSTEPCFEDSVVRRFELDDNFSKRFEELLAKIKSYESDSNQSQSVSHINKNSEKKGEMLDMDFAKIKEKLSEIKIENSDLDKYAFINATETAIGVMDREDYKVYSVDYAIVDDEVVIDYESKKACKFTVAELGENEESFDLNAEIDSVKDMVKSEVEKSISATYAESYNSKIQDITEQFDKLSEEHKSAMAELEKFRVEDARMKELAKKNEIDEIVNKFESQMNKYAAFMIWKANLDYSKTTPEDVNKELTLMLGKMTVEGGKKESFSYKPMVANIGNSNNKNMYADTERYGDYFSRLMNKDD